MIVWVAVAMAAEVDPAAAEALYRAERWEEAADAYRKIARKQPEDGLAAYRHAVSLHRAGRPEEAVGAFESALARGFYPHVTLPALAAALARTGRGDDAIDRLEEAVAAGFRRPDVLRDDADLAVLREDPRFVAVVDAADRNARPCAFDARYRAFDFWLGTWRVEDPQGAVVGRNTITADHEGCLLVERWEGAAGGAGTSLNFFDPGPGTWQQVWVDAAGQVIRYQGGPDASGAMVMVGDLARPDGSTHLTRGIWAALPDGRVRQLLEQSHDGGTTWVTGFDGTYVREE